MKCGEIWARRARTSASISRVREASSSASSSWPETHCATSSAARTSPAVGYGGEHLQGADERAPRPPAGRPMACRTGQPGSAHGQLAAVGPPGSCPTRRPARASAGGLRARGGSPAPSQASRSDRVGERHRRGPQQAAQVLDAALGAGRGQPCPQRRRGQARGVQGAEGGAVGLGAEVGPAPEAGQGERVARVRVMGRDASPWRRSPEVDEQHVGVGAVAAPPVRGSRRGSRCRRCRRSRPGRAVGSTLARKQRVT